MLNKETLKARRNNPFSMFEFRRQFYLVSAPVLLSFSPTPMHNSARSLICCLSRLSVVISRIVLGCLLCPATLKRRLCATCGSASHAFHRPHLTTQAPPPRAPDQSAAPVPGARLMSAGQSRTGSHLMSQSRLAPRLVLQRLLMDRVRRGLQVEAQRPYSVIRVPQKTGGSTCQTPMEAVGGSGSSLEDVARRL